MFATSEENPPRRAVRFAPNTGRFKALGPVGGYYPERALRVGKSGVAVIDCSVGEGGVLTKCALALETPRQYDFGAAALRMAQTKWITAAPPPDGETPEAGMARLVVPFQHPVAGPAQ